MIRYFSMFSGIGGFEYGISESGVESECIGYSEIDRSAIKVYESHYPNHRNYGNAREINPDDLPEFDMFCGGFPCQSFSIAGKRQGFQDTRGTLFYEILRIAKAKRPKILFLENVKGLLSADDGRCFHTIITSLDELGYAVEWQVLNSKHFGVPQNRERIFIIAHLRTGCTRQVFPLRQASETYPDSVTDSETMGDCASTIKRRDYQNWNGNYISIFPVLTPDRQKLRQSRRFKEDGEDMFTLTGQGVHGIAMNIQEPIVHNMQPRSPDRPSASRGGSGHLQKQDGTTYCLDRIRRLTPVEYARLQGFPDDWCSMLSDSAAYKCYGNAVTTNVICEIMKVVGEIYG
jgi:DNA (cytosine-5)-methyltransferase 1